MAVSKLSQIAAAGSPPALTDFLVGVTASAVDQLYSVSQLSRAIGLVPGTTPTISGTDKTILFDKAGVIGEDTNLEWDYTNHILNLGPNARLNSIGTTWRFDVGGTNQLDFGISNSNSWSTPISGGGIFAPFITNITASAGFAGTYVRLNTDTQNRVFFALDGGDNPYVGFGVGGNSANDTNLSRHGVGIFGIQNQTKTSPASVWVYNTSDSINTAPVANYERGVFDWTTTSNVLTIGTQKNGSGSSRNIQFVVGNTNQLDFGITNSGAWTSHANFESTIFDAVGGSGSFAGLYVGITGDVHFRIGFALDSNNRGLFALGPGVAAQVDVHIERYGAGIMGVTGGDPYGGASTPAGFQVYNSFDTIGAPTNYERGVFDWTTTSNVLTIGTQKGGSGSTRNIQFVAGNANVLDWNISVTNNWTTTFTFQAFQFNSVGASGSFPGNNVQITTDTQSRIFIGLDGSDNPAIWFGPGGGTSKDTFLNRQSAGIWGVGTSTTNTSGQVKAQNYIATGDPGSGTASTNILTNANSTTIGAGTGTVKMSSANNANNTGWLKCYIGTQVAWIPCWTTNAP